MTRRVKRTCSFKGCDKDHHAKGWCGGHYRQYVQGRTMSPLEDRGVDGSNLVLPELVSPESIFGYSGAQKAFGCSLRRIKKLFADAKRYGVQLPPRTIRQGGPAYYWPSKKALEEFAGEVERAKMAQAMPASKRTVVCSPLISSSSVVGLKAAAAVVGVPRGTFGGVIYRVRDRRDLAHLRPSMAKVGSGGRRKAYCWSSKEELVDWWTRIRDALNGNVPPVLRSSETESLSTEKMIEALLGAGMTRQLVELGEKMGTSTKETLGLAVALGFSYWPED